jgi:hypothetical protein
MKKSKNKKVLIITVSLIIFIAILAAGYYFFSINFPGSRFSMQGLKDRSSHYYQSEKPFKYGDYEFTLIASTKSLGEKEDCPNVAKKYADAGETIHYPDWIRLFSWQEVYDNALTGCNQKNAEKDKMEFLDTQMTVKNLSKTIQNIRQDWFRIEVEGKAYNNNAGINNEGGIDYFLKDSVAPGESSSNAFNTKIKKNAEARLIITLPGKASQIVNLK